MVWMVFAAASSSVVSGKVLFMDFGMGYSSRTCRCWNTRGVWASRLGHQKRLDDGLTSVEAEAANCVASCVSSKKFRDGSRVTNGNETSCENVV